MNSAEAYIHICIYGSVISWARVKQFLHSTSAFEVWPNPDATPYARYACPNGPAIATPVCEEFGTYLCFTRLLRSVSWNCRTSCVFPISQRISLMVGRVELLLSFRSIEWTFEALCREKTKCLRRAVMFVCQIVAGRQQKFVGSTYDDKHIDINIYT